jgi:hypothetical protein
MSLFVFYTTTLPNVNVVYIMSNVWLMSDELIGKRAYNDHLDLIGITVSTFYRTNWGQSRVPQSGQAVTRPTDYLTAQLPSEVDNSQCLKRSGQLCTLRWREILKNLDFRSGVCEAYFPLQYDVMPRHSTPCSQFFGQLSGHETSAEDYVPMQCLVPEERNILYICLKVVCGWE